MQNFGVDLGMGAIKICGQSGMLQFPSQVSTVTSPALGAVHGLRAKNPPVVITLPGGSAFYVGSDAHEAGRPLENLERDRFEGSPEMRALFYGALTKISELGPLNQPMSLTLGLPLETLSGEQTRSTIEHVQGWVKGNHEWMANSLPHSVDIRSVHVTLQPVGGLSDFLLDEMGNPNPIRKSYQTHEIGILSIGFCTLEMMAVQRRSPIQRFTSSSTAGVRRLLEIVNANRLYSLGELDTRLRAGNLNIAVALPIWEREIIGEIERIWGTAWKRFTFVLLMGGGVLLLQNTLLKKFGERAVMMTDPVFSIARGLYKLELNTARRKNPEDA